MARSAKALGTPRRHLIIVLVLCLSFTLCGFMDSNAVAKNRQHFVLNSMVQSDGSIDVSGDDTADAYRGTGGLLLPSSYSGTGKSRQAIGSCLDCIWRYTVYCDASSAVLCAHAVSTCSSGQIRYRVWFGKVNELEKMVGSVCWGVGKPATRRDFETQMASSVLRYVPALKPGVAPGGSTYTSVPIMVWSRQPAVFKPAAMYLSGNRVQIRATAMWQWLWGDGSAQWSASPGAQFPKHTISHQYRKAGRYKVQVRTVWRATYEVPGIGSFSTQGELINQNAQFSMIVRSGRAVLVAQ